MRRGYERDRGLLTERCIPQSHAWEKLWCHYCTNMSCGIRSHARLTPKIRACVVLFFLTFPLFLYLYILPFQSSGTRHGSPIFLFLFYIPSSFLLFKFPGSSLLSGKGLRWQPCTCSRRLYLSLFAQKPEQQKREWKHGQPKHPHTNVQITHVHTVASHRHSDTRTHKMISLIFTHRFPLHRPVVHVKYFLFPAVRQCDRSPCGRGATCQETPGGYRCLCPPGWTGRTCQLGQWVRVKQLQCILYIYVHS